jgi:hypothetical protein
MNPTTYELAKLAAMLPTGKPYDRVKTAVAIWNHAKTQLAIQRLEKLESAPAAWAELPALLAELMPKKSKADREDTWMAFLVWQMQHARTGVFIVPREISKDECKERGLKFPTTGQRTIAPGDKVNLSEAVALAEMTLEQHRENGIAKPDEMAAAFKTWAQENKAKNLSSRGSKGGRARQAKAKGKGEAVGKTTKTKKVLGTAKMPASKGSAPASSDAPPASKKWVSRKQRPTMR